MSFDCLGGGTCTHRREYPEATLGRSRLFLSRGHDGAIYEHGLKFT